MWVPLSSWMATENGHWELVVSVHCESLEVVGSSPNTGWPESSGAEEPVEAPLHPAEVHMLLLPGALGRPPSLRQELVVPGAGTAECWCDTSGTATALSPGLWWALLFQPLLPPPPLPVWYLRSERRQNPCQGEKGPKEAPFLLPLLSSVS